MPATMVNVMKVTSGELTAIGFEHTRGVGGGITTEVEVSVEIPDIEHANRMIDSGRSKFNQTIVGTKEKTLGKEFERVMGELKKDYEIVGRLKKSGEKKHQSKVVSAEVYRSPWGFERDSKGDIVKNRDGSAKLVEPEKTLKYLRRCVDFVAQENGDKDRILSAIIHLDESTPHIHITSIPLVEARKETRTKKGTKQFGEPLKDKNGKQVYKVLMSARFAGKDSYSRLHDRFHKFISKDFPEVERGIPKAQSGRRYMRMPEYRAQSEEMRRIAKIEGKETFMSTVRRHIPETLKKQKAGRPEKFRQRVGLAIRNGFARWAAKPEVEILPKEEVSELKRSAQANLHFQTAINAIPERELALDEEWKRREKEFAEREKRLELEKYGVEAKIAEMKALEKTDLVQERNELKEWEADLSKEHHRLEVVEGKLDSREQILDGRGRDLGRRESELPTREQFQRVLERQRDLVEQLAGARIPTGRPGEVSVLEENSIKFVGEAFNEANSDMKRASGGGWIPPMVRAEIVIARSKEMEKGISH